MKIQLERTLPTCPPNLNCLACCQPFAVGRIRTLLCDDSGLIYGDICPDCLKTKARGIKQRLKTQTINLLNQLKTSNSQTKTKHDLALELLQAATPEIKLPKFYQWWLKRLEIFSQETQELEIARLGSSNCRCGKGRSRLQILFEEEEG